MPGLIQDPEVPGGVMELPEGRVERQSVCHMVSVKADSSLWRPELMASRYSRRYSPNLSTYAIWCVACM